MVLQVPGDRLRAGVQALPRKLFPQPYDQLDGGIGDRLCWSKTRPAGLTLDYSADTISARVRRARLSTPGDSDLLARAAGAVLGVQGRGDPRAAARGRRAAPGEPEAAAVVE